MIQTQRKAIPNNIRYLVNNPMSYKTQNMGLLFSLIVLIID